MYYQHYVWKLFANFIKASAFGSIAAKSEFGSIHDWFCSEHIDLPFTSVYLSRQICLHGSWCRIWSLLIIWAQHCVSDRMYGSIGHCSCKDRSYALPLINLLRSQHPCTQRALAAPCLGCKQFQLVNCLWHARLAPACRLSTKPSLNKHRLTKKCQGTHRFTCA